MKTAGTGQGIRERPQAGLQEKEEEDKQEGQKGGQETATKTETETHSMLDLVA